jgi:RNA polymerase sigma-70 factor (ECF subfamily)
MPFRRSSRSKPHADDALRGPDDAVPGPGEESPDDLLGQAEPLENEALPDGGDDPAIDPSPDVEAGPEEDEDAAQRFAEDSVKEDMATAAVHPQSQVGPYPGEIQTGSVAAALAPGGWSQLSDAEIMLRVAAGDEAGFSLLVEKYRRQMVHYMFRMVHNQAIAEELAQEVFLRVYRARASYRAEAKFSTWLYRIATTAATAFFARDCRLTSCRLGVFPAASSTSPMNTTSPRSPAPPALVAARARAPIGYATAAGCWLSVIRYRMGIISASGSISRR